MRRQLLLRHILFVIPSGWKSWSTAARRGPASGVGGPPLTSHSLSLSLPSVTPVCLCVSCMWAQLQASKCSVCVLCPIFAPEEIADGLEKGSQNGLHDGWIVHGRVNWEAVRGKVKRPKIVCATFNSGGHVSCHLWPVASHFDYYNEPPLSGYKLHHQRRMVRRHLLDKSLWY